MDKHPIRRKFIDNPYTLSSSKNDDLYIISFIDSNGIVQNVKVDKEVYDLFDDNEKYENARFKEYNDHILLGQYNDEIISKATSIEDEILNNLIVDDIRKVISSLPTIQKKRIYKYFFQNKTLEQIAKEERCSKVAIKHSIDRALEKISKKFIF